MMARLDEPVCPQKKPAKPVRKAPKFKQGSGGTGMYAANDILTKRCGACHGYTGQDGSLLLRFSTTGDGKWDLEHPRRSIMLRAPLAKDKGGLGLCRGVYIEYPDGRTIAPRKPKPDEAALFEKRSEMDEALDDLLDGDGQDSGGDLFDVKTAEQPVFKTVGAPFTDRRDPDYLALLEQIEKARPWRKRCDMEGFRPNDHYLREMKRYGILRADYCLEEPIDVFVLDRAYWESLWYVPKP